MVWEQELYNNFKYFTPRTYFHTFSADVSGYLWNVLSSLFVSVGQSYVSPLNLNIELTFLFELIWIWFGTSFKQPLSRPSHTLSQIRSAYHFTNTFLTQLVQFFHSWPFFNSTFLPLSHKLVSLHLKGVENSVIWV